MKSIVQEASTIAKAVEKGWKEAGEPHEFSVKVLELPEHNFIGLTTRSAKVAIMFNDVTPQKKPQARHSERPTQKQPSKARPLNQREKKNQQSSPAQPAAPERVEKKQIEQRQPVQPQPEQKEVAEKKASRKRPEGLWNEDLVNFARSWFTATLKHMGSNVTFTIEPQNFYLRITLSKPILSDEAKEKHLLASLSSLMLATTKKEFRKALRGHKIVLTHQ